MTLPLTATLRRLPTALGRLVSNRPLASFRILFGSLMLWEVTRYFRYGWIDRYYVRPRFHFTYFGFGWVAPWPGDGMYLHFAALGDY